VILRTIAGVVIATGTGGECSNPDEGERQGTEAAHSHGRRFSKITASANPSTCHAVLVRCPVGRRMGALKI
jgi:hypothetical protein